MSEDKGMSAEREAQLRGYQSLTGCNGEELFLEIDRLRAANAVMEERVRAAEETAKRAEWDADTIRADYAGSVAVYDKRIAALDKERAEARAERDAVLKIPGLPAGMRIVRIANNAKLTIGGGTEYALAQLAPLEDEAPPEPPKMVCMLCGFPAKYCEDEKLWRHVPSNGIICDKYGYPINVKPEPNAKGTCVCEIGKRFNSACPQHGGHPEAIEQAPEQGAKGVSAEAGKAVAYACNNVACQLAGVHIEGCNPPNSNPAQAPDPQFTDRERLDWLESYIKNGSANTIFTPEKDGGSLREAINAAMLSAGLRPKRESVTMGKLFEIFRTEFYRSGVTGDAALKAGIRAVLTLARASDGTMKDVED